MSDFKCGLHRAFVYARGGITLLGELTPLTHVEWRRIRDDISTAVAWIGVNECCDFLGDLETVSMEIHITRNDLDVWEGVITRLEYALDRVTIYADDILWVARRTALAVGYSMAYPSIGSAIDRMDWLIRDQCFAKYGDPWNMVPEHLHKIPNLTEGDPRSSRSVERYSVNVWEDFDKFAEDIGTDYTVVNRDIYYWDINYAWATLPDLHEGDISEYPVVSEYGNELATGYVTTNNSGFAGIAVAPPSVVDHYGHIDIVDSSWNEAVVAQPGEDPVPAPVPTPEELAEMLAAATRQLTSRYPPPVSIVIPANATLLPSSTWDLPDMIPGAWFEVSLTRLCRNVTETQRLHEIRVTEDAPAGEIVAITAISAPRTRVEPP
jgi:hypothetical protein